MPDPKPKVTAKVKADANWKKVYQEKGVCPKCGESMFVTAPDRPKMCSYCRWLVPKGWKSKDELEVEAYKKDQETKAKKIKAEEEESGTAATKMFYGR